MKARGIACLCEPVSGTMQEKLLQEGAHGDQKGKPTQLFIFLFPLMAVASQ